MKQLTSLGRIIKSRESTVVHMFRLEKHKEGNTVYYSQTDDEQHFS